MATDYSQLLTNPELAGFERQRRMAEMLVQRGQKTPQGQMIGNIYVGASPYEFLGNLAQQYVGEKDIDKKELSMAQALREAKLAETTGIMSALTGTPDQRTELAGPAYQGVAFQAVMPGTPGSPQEALALALKSQTGAGNVLLPSIIEQVLPKQIPDQIKYKLAKEGGFTGTFNEFINQMSDVDKARIQLDKQRLGFEGQRVGLEGERLNLEKLKAAQELTYGKPLTESQAKATAFQSQMIGAENNLKQLEAKGFDPSSLKTQTALKMAGGPLNIISAPEAQQYKQAQEQWAEAYLRFKTGAAATEGEVQRNIKTFFPQFGDKPQQVAQKAAARAQAEQDIGFAAGMGAGRGAQPIAPAQSTGGWSVKSVK
jgi:hypothetical protein